MEGGAFPRASAVVLCVFVILLLIAHRIGNRIANFGGAHASVSLCYMPSKKVRDRTCAYAVHV